MSFALRARCGAALEQRDAQALRRNLQVSEPSTAGRVLRAGKSLKVVDDQWRTPTRRVC